MIAHHGLRLNHCSTKCEILIALRTSTILQWHKKKDNVECSESQKCSLWRRTSASLLLVQTFPDIKMHKKAIIVNYIPSFRFFSNQAHWLIHSNGNHRSLSTIESTSVFNIFSCGSAKNFPAGTTPPLPRCHRPEAGRKH